MTIAFFSLRHILHGTHKAHGEGDTQNIEDMMTFPTYVQAKKAYDTLSPITKVYYTICTWTMCWGEDE